MKIDWTTPPEFDCRVDENFKTIGEDWRNYAYLGFDSRGILMGLSNTEEGILRMNPKAVWHNRDESSHLPHYHKPPKKQLGIVVEIPAHEH